QRQRWRGDLRRFRRRGLPAAEDTAFLVVFGFGARRFRLALGRLQTQRFRRRSSRQAWNESMLRSAVDFSIPSSAAKKRPNENCVDMIAARKISARMTIIEPVRARYSESSTATNSPT